MWRRVLSGVLAAGVVSGVAYASYVGSFSEHSVLLGAGADSIKTLAPGTSGHPLLSQGASSDPAYGQLSLTTGVTDILPVPNGGTGLSAITAHNLLVGNGTSAATLLAPGTTGLPVVSQGAAADPAYAALGVVGGGTGQVSLTQYAVLLGDGTSAITATSPGTAGYPLVSGGAAAFPSFDQLVLGGIQPINNSTVLGNVSGGAASPSALTATQLTTLCNPFTDLLSGCAPASGGGTTNFLRADGTWAAAAASIPTADLLGGNGSSFTSVTVGSQLDLTAGTLSAPNFDDVTSGTVPASGGGTSNYLRADGSWAAPAASFGATCTDSGGTPRTCNGSVGKVTTNVLTNPPGVENIFIINNSSVTASSVVLCSMEVALATVGPAIINCAPGLGSITVEIINAYALVDLAQTVTINFLVVN